MDLWVSVSNVPQHKATHVGPWEGTPALSSQQLASPKLSLQTWVRLERFMKWYQEAPSAEAPLSRSPQLQEAYEGLRHLCPRTSCPVSATGRLWVRPPALGAAMCSTRAGGGAPRPHLWPGSGRDGCGHVGVDSNLRNACGTDTTISPRGRCGLQAQHTWGSCPRPTTGQRACSSCVPRLAIQLPHSP